MSLITRDRWATQTGRAGLGSTPHRWFSREDSRGCRDMVITELKMIEEEKKVATAAGQAKKCAWMNWEEAEARKLSWSSMMTMEPLALSFLLRSTYNLLPTPANHKQWGFTGDDTCTMSKSARGTLQHILSSCGSSLQMYTWRHNRVLAILAEITETQCWVASKQPIIALWGWFSCDVLPVTCCEHGPPSIATVHFSKFSIATNILFN